MPELRIILGGDCTTAQYDMSNAASTWVGLFAGVIIGAIITWWIYNRQKKTSEKQDEVIKHILHLEERNKSMLEKIYRLEEKIDSILEKK